MHLRFYACVGFLFLVGVVGCAGNSSTTPPGPALLAPPARGAASLTVTIVVPARGSAAIRHPSWVSPSTSLVQIAVSQASAAPLVTSAPCSSISCTVSLGGLPTGNVNVAAGLLDSGNQLLAGGSVSATLTASGPNTITLPVGGFVNQVSLRANPIGFSPGTAGTGVLTALAQDIDGNTITGAAPYLNPIVLTNSDNTNVITLSSPAFSAPGQSINVVYSGATAIKSATLGAIGLNPANVVSAGILLRNIYIADAFNNKVRVFSPGGTPIAGLDPIGSFSFPNILYVDAADNLFVGDYTTVTSFAPGSGTATTTSGSIFSGAVYTLAEDSSGRLIAGDNIGNVKVFSPALTLTPFTSISTGLSNARYGTVNAFNNLYIPDNFTNVVKVYQPVVAASPPPLASFSPISIVSGGLTSAQSGPGGQVCVTAPASTGGDTISLYAAGNGTPYATIVLTPVGYAFNPQFCAFDANGNVYSANYTANTVTEYSGTTQALIATYPTANHPMTLAFDPSGYLFVADYNGSTVQVFRPPAPALVTSYSLGGGSPTFVAFGH